MIEKHYSILHISDLHKPANSNLDNLFYSLQKDCEEYAKDEIAKPEIIVVSGDIVEGSKSDDGVNIICAQYKEATNFLNKLVDYFLDGDKRRMVIVPGNHDYCYKISKDSMTLSPEEKLKDDLKLMKEGNPVVRWNWDDRRYYHITDKERYARRFDLFKAFYNEFFNGIRELPEQIEQSSYIVELSEYHIAFVCFNSCHRLDHLNPMGCICPDAIASSHTRLTNLKNMGYLLVGVWHHHVSGLPAENNYMDYRILDAMIREDIKMGLFGHQHVSMAVQEYRDITSKQNSILLLSSGSLYGNRNQLVTGIPRQYNIIELNQKDDVAKMRLHVRKDNSQYGYDIPQWILSPIGMKHLSCYNHELLIEKAQVEYVVADIEAMVKNNGDYLEACKRLLEYGLDNELALRYFDSYVSKIDNKGELRELLWRPITMPQYMTALDTAVAAKDKEWVVNLLALEEFDSPFIRELKVQAKKLL